MRPAGCEGQRAFCLWLGGDAFGAGQVRGQELSGSVQCGGRFVEDRVVGLEDVRHPGGDVEGDLDVGDSGLPGEADGVIEEDLVGSGLDDQGRQAGQVSLPARCSRRISLRPGLAGQRSRAGSPMSDHCRNIPAGRPATTRLAARQVSRRHQITVIRAAGPGPPKVLMVLTPGARGLEQEQPVPRASGPGARALVLGTAPSRDSDRVRAKYLPSR